VTTKLIQAISYCQDVIGWCTSVVDAFLTRYLARK